MWRCLRISQNHIPWIGSYMSRARSLRRKTVLDTRVLRPCSQAMILLVQLWLLSLTLHHILRTSILFILLVFASGDGRGINDNPCSSSFFAVRLPVFFPPCFMREQCKLATGDLSNRFSKLVVKKAGFRGRAPDRWDHLRSAALSRRLYRRAKSVSNFSPKYPQLRACEGWKVQSLPPQTIQVRMLIDLST
jgi:hypothetical protein